MDQNRHIVNSYFVWSRESGGKLCRPSLIWNGVRMVANARPRPLQREDPGKIGTALHCWANIHGFLNEPGIKYVLYRLIGMAFHAYQRKLGPQKPPWLCMHSYNGCRTFSQSQSFFATMPRKISSYGKIVVILFLGDC